MFIVWGYKKKSIDLGATRSRRCAQCEFVRPFRTHVYYQHNHLWYAFGFVSGRQFTETCEVCGHESAVDAAVVKAELGKDPIPYWDRFGMLSAFGGLIAMVLFLLLLRVTGPEIRNIPDLTERMKRGDDTALAQLRREASQGDLPSQEALADLLSGGGHQRFLNLEEGYRWALAAAKQGSVGAQVSVGWRLESGTGVDTNLDEAMRWYRVAAKQGSTIAQNSVGAFYRQGTGVPADQKEAARWFRIAAESGDIPAAYNLGLTYLEGNAEKANMAEAIRWLEVAANTPMTDSTSVKTAASANNELGNLYEKGLGVEQDVLKALNHYQAASANNTDAAASVDRLKQRLAQKGA
ncbi:MAG: tetratricopeptide repeat protein [Dokdonella sp.]